MEERLWC